MHQFKHNWNSLLVQKIILAQTTTGASLFLQAWHTVLLLHFCKNAKIMYCTSKIFIYATDSFVILIYEIMDHIFQNRTVFANWLV